MSLSINFVFMVRRVFSRLFFIGCFSQLILGCSKPGGDDGGGGGTNLVGPTVITNAATTITTSSAGVGGNVTSDGGASVTERGVCYSTTPNPSTSGNKIQSGSGLGNFSGTISGLNPNTNYYIRAYAINSVGTSYGTELSFTTQQIAAPPIDSAVSLYVGGWKSLYAYNAATGQLKWKKDLPDYVFSSPVYANGKVYVGCADAKLYVFDTLGNTAWTATTGGYIGNQSPTVGNGLVYICSESGSRLVNAYNAQTGSIAWQYDASEIGISGGFGTSDLTLFDNTIYINNTRLYAIDAITGTLRWKYSPSTGSGGTTPIKVNNKLYVLGDHALVVLNPANGTVIWEKNSWSDFTDPKGLNYANGKLYYTDDDFMAAHDTINGTEIWRNNQYYTTPIETGYYPAVVNDTFYYNSPGSVYLGSANSGAYLNFFPAGGRSGGFTIVNRTIYFCGEASLNPPATTYHVFAFDLDTRNMLWRTTNLISFPFLVSSPCIVTKSGKTYRFGKVFN